MFKFISKKLSSLISALVLTAHAAAADTPDDYRQMAEEMISPFSVSCLEEFSKITVDDVNANVKWEEPFVQQSWSRVSLRTIAEEEDSTAQDLNISITKAVDGTSNIFIAHANGFRAPYGYARYNVTLYFNEQNQTAMRVGEKRHNYADERMLSVSQERTSFVESILSACGITPK